MEKKEFKKIFANIVNTRGFSYFSNFWFTESNECIFVIKLTKSSYGNYYYLEMEIFIQGVFGKKYLIDKNLGKAWGDISRRPPTEYDTFLDLDAQISSEERKQGLESLLDEFVIPFSKKALSLLGVRSFINEHQFVMSDALRNQVEKLIEAKKSQQPE